MSAAFDVNLMTSSFIIYATLIMQIKFENCNILTKFVLLYSFPLLIFLIIFQFEAANNMFSTNCKKICCSFGENIILEKSKMVDKVVAEEY